MSEISSPRDTVPTPGGCSYSVVVGPEAAFSGSLRKSSTEEKRKDTIFLVERRTPINWMDPSREMTFDTACEGVGADAMGISSYHSGGVNTAWGDGSVRYLDDTIDAATPRKMLTLDKKAEAHFESEPRTQ